MRKWEDVVISQFGGVVKSASVTVKNAGLQTSPTIYSDNGTSTITDSTVSADALGRYAFYVAAGRYDLNISGAGITAYTESDVLIFDPNDVSDGAAYVRTIQSGTGAVAEDVQGFLRRLAISATSYMTDAQRADVAAGTSLLNVAAAVQAAINRANTLGAILYFPPGIYLLGTTSLVIKNNVIYRGSGKDLSAIKGTVLQYTGTSDALQINNPINSSTNANIVMEDFAVQCTVRTAGKAAIADVGSTGLSIKRVQTSGNDYGIILDQSELAVVSECDVEIPASGTAGIWLVNGAEHTGGANTYFTNRITIEKSQFNGTVGVGIADDGGSMHTFSDNNFNAMAKHIRVNGVNGLMIDGNEFETPTTTSIEFATTKLGGNAGAQSSTVTIETNFNTSPAAIPLVTFTNNSSVLSLAHRNNHYTNSNAGGSVFSNFANGIGTGIYIGYGNKQLGISTATVGNSFDRKTSYTPTFTSSNSDAAIGNGTITGYYVPNGDAIKAWVNFTVGSTTTVGTGTFKFSLPFLGEGALIEIGSWFGSAAGANKTGIVQNNGGASFVSVWEVTAGFVGGASYVWAAGDSIKLFIAYTSAPTRLSER